MEGQNATQLRARIQCFLHLIADLMHPKTVPDLVQFAKTAKLMPPKLLSTAQLSCAEKCQALLELFVAHPKHLVQVCGLIVIRRSELVNLIIGRYPPRELADYALFKNHRAVMGLCKMRWLDTVLRNGIICQRVYNYILRRHAPTTMKGVYLNMIDEEWSYGKLNMFVDCLRSVSTRVYISAQLHPPPRFDVPRIPNALSCFETQYYNPIESTSTESTSTQVCPECRDISGGAAAHESDSWRVTTAARLSDKHITCYKTESMREEYTQSFCQIPPPRRRSAVEIHPRTDFKNCSCKKTVTSTPGTQRGNTAETEIVTPVPPQVNAHGYHTTETNCGWSEPDLRMQSVPAEVCNGVQFEGNSHSPHTAQAHTQSQCSVAGSWGNNNAISCTTEDIILVGEEPQSRKHPPILDSTNTVWCNIKPVSSTTPEKPPPHMHQASHPTQHTHTPYKTTLGFISQHTQAPHTTVQHSIDSSREEKHHTDPNFRQSPNTATHVSPPAAPNANLAHLYFRPWSSTCTTQCTNASQSVPTSHVITPLYHHSLHNSTTPQTAHLSHPTHTSSYSTHSNHIAHSTFLWQSSTPSQPPSLFMQPHQYEGYTPRKRPSGTNFHTHSFEPKKAQYTPHTPYPVNNPTHSTNNNRLIHSSSAPNISMHPYYYYNEGTKETQSAPILKPTPRVPRAAQYPPMQYSPISSTYTNI
ncbi:ORF11 [Ranid herpesvirus 1]|uniref:ORF11 n=1 Tax=Ranid herpesvirus 1 TaxID=85655 RepID=Q14VU7_9VIRU|nr:ORF11 [Ranid herpesvirus 1]ABG25718.1 ORF11 [Ranid herpesvirus 1]